MKEIDKDIKIKICCSDCGKYCDDACGWNGEKNSRRFCYYFGFSLLFDHEARKWKRISLCSKEFGDQND